MSRGGVRKPAAKKKATGAVVSKRIQLRGRGSSRAEAAGRSNRAEDGELDSEEETPASQQQGKHQVEQPASQQGGGAQMQPASRKRKSAAAAGSSGSRSTETILSLTSEALQEIFKCLGEQQSYCRWVLGKRGMQLGCSQARSKGPLVRRSLARRADHPPCPAFHVAMQGGASTSVQTLPGCAAAAQLRLGGKSESYCVAALL